MAYTVRDAVSELEGILHGTTTNQITGLYGVFNRAARQFVLDVDAQETIRTEQTSQIFSRVYEYDPPTDLKGNRVIDIRPQSDRSLSDNPNNTYSRNFSLGKGRILNPQINVEFNSATKKLLINNPRLPMPIQFANTTSIIGNGTWSTSLGASNLSENNTDYVNGTSSLQFDLAVSGTQAIIDNSTLAQIDLSEHLNQSNLFLSMELPTASTFTSFELRWGSSASAYWTKTETTQFGGDALVNGWNLFGFDWSSATKVGSPDAGAIDYCALIINYNGIAQTGVKMSGITSNLGTIYDVQYYSKCLFRSSAGVWVDKLPNDGTDDDYIINLDTESYNIFIFKLSEYCVQQALGQDATYDTTFFRGKYDEALTRYKTLYPSQAIKLRERYYQTPNQGYRRNWGVPYTR